MGCDFTLLLGCALFIHFNPRTPGGVRLQYAWLVDRHVNISIHAPRVGCDCNIGRNFLGRRYFNPRTPGGVRLIISALHIINICISIHAPRVGCDPTIYVARYSFVVISIHAPRVGCDYLCAGQDYQGTAISIHAPRVGCDSAFYKRLYFRHISIHAPRVGCDAGNPYPADNSYQFQSTHPGWGATYRYRCIACPLGHFNPRTPGGVRLFFCNFNSVDKLFQSTHPGWGATYCIAIIRCV